MINFKGKRYNKEDMWELLEKVCAELDSIPREHSCEVQDWEFGSLESRVDELESKIERLKK